MALFVKFFKIVYNNSTLKFNKSYQERGERIGLKIRQQPSFASLKQSSGRQA